jgi:hypothetical protein
MEVAVPVTGKFVLIVHAADEMAFLVLFERRPQPLVDMALRTCWHINTSHSLSSWFIIVCRAFMVMRFFAILFGILLLFGCTTTAPSEDTGPAQPSVPAEPPAVNDTANDTVSMTCGEYCPTQPHIQCVGSWDISGTYPDCVCDFECDEVDLNVTEEEASDELELVPKSNKTLSQMLNESLTQIRSDFFKKYDGSFEQTTYTWKRSKTLDTEPGDIVFDAAPLTDVKFDDKTIPSIQAAGFIVFDDGIEPVSRGVAIFMNSTPVLPFSGENFDVEYFYSVEHRYMHDCSVTTEDLSRNSDGEWVTSSYLSCMSVSALEDD